MKNKQVFLFVSLIFALMMLLGLSSAALAEGGQVSGVVWNDKNIDGLFDGERVMPGVNVSLCRELEDGSFEELVSTRTGDDGMYAFSMPEDGEYTLWFSLPEDYRFTLHGLDSSVLPSVGRRGHTPAFSLSGGQVLTMNAGGTTGNSYLSIIAFEDKNLNGGRMDSEPRVRGISVELHYEYNGKDYLIATALTDKNGETSISRVSPGTYYLKAILPENYVAGPLGAKFSNFYNCMQPSIDNICYTAPFTVEMKGSTPIGIGVVTTGSLDGSIWNDDNGNQLHDANETGCVNASVSLYAPSLDITRTAEVAPDGTFSFTGLQPAQYDLIFTLPEGMIFADSADSQLHDIASKASLSVLVENLQHTHVEPVGATVASRVEISVFDVSNDSLVPLANVEGSFTQYGTLIGTAVSDENGVMSFPIARSGMGTVSVTLPEGYVVAPEGGAFPYANCTTNASFDVAVPLNDTYKAEGYAIASASVSGILVEDATNTGVITSDCMPLSGFTVQAIDANGAVCQTAVTDATGAYTLPNLVPDTYYIRFLLDDRYIATPCLSDENSEYNAIYMQEPLFGETDAIVLYPGQHKVSVNGALFRAGTVDGYVFLNSAYDLLATNDGGAQGITVTLLDENGNPWQDYAYDITDENGFFCIKGILPGQYTLQYTLPEDCAFVAPATADNTYFSEKFTIENGSEIHVDALGAVYTATFCGTVTDYTSKAPVPAELSLTSLRTGEVTKVLSEENGAYAFEHMLPGDYTFTVSLADGYLFADTAASILPYLNDSTATAEISLPMGSVQEDQNIVASMPVDWQFTLYYDVNANGVQDADEPAAANRSGELHLRDNFIGSYTSDANGIISIADIIPASYTLTLSLQDNEILTTASGNACAIDNNGLSCGILPYASIAGQVWSLDGTENGVSGIEIALVQNKVQLATATTDEHGSFRFDNLLQGDYQLRAALQDGYLFARMQDAQTRNSYILSQTDGSLLFGVIPLQMGQQFTTVDIGIGGMGAIGDTAWLDENNNGMQDIGEPGLPNILIEMYQHDVLVASTTTDVYGHYNLTGLYPGVYEMRVTMPKEAKTAKQQTAFPLVASIMPEGAEGTAVVESAIVPSMGRNLNMDLGFVLKKKNVYPQSMSLIPQKDWTPYMHFEED